MIPLGPCQNPDCRYDGPEHVLAEDVTTLWECVKCGAKMKYLSTSDSAIREIHIQDQAEAAQQMGG